MAAATVCIIRPTGTLKPGIIMFCLTPVAMVADILCHRFAKLLGRNRAMSVHVRRGTPSPDT
jgi:hypothetical protein